MGIISGKKFKDALEKAGAVGIHEEPLTLGEAKLILRNLRPDEYTAIYEENKDREGIDSLYNFQKSHISRAIQEYNGIDLRDVDFVDDEEEIRDPKTGELVLDQATGQPKLRKVRLELHDYLRLKFIDRWTKEPLQVAWRKFLDIVKIAEDESKQGVTFILPEQTPEERLREAIANAREVMSEVPEAIVESVLEEAGLMRISTAEEIKRAMEATDQLAREKAPSEPAPAETPAPTVPAQDMMARRTPLNRQVEVSPPPVQQVPVQAPPVPQTPPQPPPQVMGAEAIRAAQRAQRIAAIEAESLDIPVTPGDPNMTLRHVPAGAPTPAHQPNAPHLRSAGAVPSEVPVLQKGRDQVDMKAFDQSVNRPPVAGINPKFRAPR